MQLGKQGCCLRVRRRSHGRADCTPAFLAAPVPRRHGAAAPTCRPAATARLLQAAPLFEAFWQGRLIPGACVPSLPFVDAVRTKRTAAAKDVLPDEVFGRIRCACAAASARPLWLRGVTGDG